MTKSRWRIIGIGNDFRRDDGAGLAVIRRLEGQLPEDISLVEYQGDGTGLIELWAGCNGTVLVDAVHSGAAPGTVQRFAGGSLPRAVFRSTSHRFGVAEAVELARALGRLPERLIVYGIEGAEYGYGEGLTAAVAEAVAEVAQAIATAYASRNFFQPP